MILLIHRFERTSLTRAKFIPLTLQNVRGESSISPFIRKFEPTNLTRGIKFNFLHYKAFEVRDCYLYPSLNLQI